MKHSIKILFITGTLLSLAEESMSQYVHSRNNGALQNSVVIIRSDNSAGDQNQIQTSDLDFQIWDSNTRLSTPQGRIGIVGEGTASQALEASGRMAFYTANEAYPSPILTERMRIDKNGNIGIGTTSPDMKLHVQTIGQYLSRFHHTGTHSISGIRIGRTSSYADLVSLSSGFGIGTATSSTDLPLFSQSGSDINFFVSNSSGNVGIGTIVPDAKLTVKGDIHTQEVTVDLQGAVVPDFVFEEDYVLKTLEETEEYIHANKHLPEIPSASEMEENGFELKEMDLKLLQKVEELTLYLIEQNKEIKALKEKMAKLEGEK